MYFLCEFLLPRTSGHIIQPHRPPTWEGMGGAMERTSEASENGDDNSENDDLPNPRQSPALQVNTHRLFSTSRISFKSSQAETIAS